MGIMLLGLLQHQAPHPIPDVRAAKMCKCAGTLWVVVLAALSQSGPAYRAQIAGGSLHGGMVVVVMGWGVGRSEGGG